MKLFVNFGLIFSIAVVLFNSVSCLPSISVGNTSPKDALQKFYGAVQKGDVKAVRQTLSRRINDRIDTVAKSNPAPAYQPETLVETIRKNLSPQMPAVRNEKTDGNRGTLAIDALFTNDKNTRTRRTVSFVKEDYSWKIDDDIVFSAESNDE